MTRVMINGLPGKMAQEVALAVRASTDLALMPYSLTGKRSDNEILLGEDKLKITTIKPGERIKKLRDLMEIKPFISIDFTVPNAANSNVDFYCNNNLPFVMGTTGGNSKTLEQKVQNSSNLAVIAPNMAKQVVGFQAMMSYAAENFPDLFRDYSLQITESHQSGKADTSGTAKRMVDYFNKLGIPFNIDQIVMIRDRERQAEIGIPTEALDGHGWHTYTLKSKNGSVLFEFKHNINGRKIYADGTLDAVRFLAKKIKMGEKGKVYSMIDVLKDK